MNNKKNKFKPARAFTGHSKCINEYQYFTFYEKCQQKENTENQWWPESLLFFKNLNKYFMSSVILGLKKGCQHILKVPGKQFKIDSKTGKCKSHCLYSLLTFFMMLQNSGSDFKAIFSLYVGNRFSAIICFFLQIK